LAGENRLTISGLKKGDVLAVQFHQNESGDATILLGNKNCFETYILSKDRNIDRIILTNKPNAIDFVQITKVGKKYLFKIVYDFN